LKYAANRTLTTNDNGQRRRSATSESGKSLPHSKLRQNQSLSHPNQDVGKGEGSRPWLIWIDLSIVRLTFFLHRFAFHVLTGHGGAAFYDG